MAPQHETPYNPAQLTFNVNMWLSLVCRNFSSLSSVPVLLTGDLNMM